MNKFFFILFPLFAILAITSHAQIDTININQVVVTSTRAPRQLKDTPIITKVITAKDIKKYGRTKIEDILSSELAGIEFHQSGYGTTLSFQGLDARHVLILIDGEKIAGEVYGNIDFSRINPLSIERIEVIKGPNSVLYGSSAMGATINIITKSAKEGVNGSVQAKFAPRYQENSGEGINGDVNNIDAAGYLSAVWGKLQSLTDIKIQSSDPYRIVGSEMDRREYIYVDEEKTGANVVPTNNILYVPIDKDGISISGWKMATISQKFKFNASERLTLSISGNYYVKERFDLNDYDAVEGDDDNYFYYSGLSLSGKIEYKIGDNGSLSYSYNSSLSHQDEMSLGSTTPKQDHNLYSHRLLFLHNRGRSHLLAGVEYNSEALRYDLYTEGYGIKRRLSSQSVFLLEEYNITDKFSAVAGVRAQYDGGEEGEIIVTPNISAIYKSDNIVYRANWSQGYRTPTLKELYIKYWQPYMGSWIVGSSDLCAERNNYLSLSAEYFSASRRFTLAASVYMNNFTDKIDAYYDEDENSYVYANTEETKIVGVEIMGRGMILNNWWVGGHYAYNHNEERAPTNSSQYIFTSPHTASINTSYRYIKGDFCYDLNLSCRYIGSKDYEDRMPTVMTYENQIIPSIIYGIYKAHYDGYYIADFSCTIDYRERLQLILTADNIFNYNPTIATFNAAVTPGINFNIGLRFNF